MIKILDCTTRDGGYITNWNFEDKFVINLIRTLNNSGVTYYEIGYRNHSDTENKGRFYNCTPEFLEKFYKIRNGLKLGVMTDIKRFSPKDFPGAGNDFIDFIRVACHPDSIADALDITRGLYYNGYAVFVQLMDISNIDEFGYLTLYKWEYKDILESIYIADSYGTILTEDVEKYFHKLQMLGYRKISFHAHNKNGKALSNSLKAMDLGAYSIDVTQNGIGRSGGNLAADEFFNKYLRKS